MKKRALISVFDKNNLEVIGRFLWERGYEIISTGGTYRKLHEMGIPAVKVKDITRSPEILGGRVKSLHPNIYGGLLARRENEEDIKTLIEEGINTIDIVVVNLYPFFQGIKDGREMDEMVELIDIGGPSMLRAAAKNHKDVLVVPSVCDYERVIEDIENNGSPTIALKRAMAAKAFNITSSYDAAISTYLMENIDDGKEVEEYLSLSYKKSTSLRYGENAHQKADLYLRNDGKGVMNNIDILWGKALSYNNIKDLDIAWKVAQEFQEPACCALKHNTPCGVAVAEDICTAYKKAYSCDPISIFGGIVAFNGRVDKDTALEMNKLFLEIVMAPEFDQEALEVLKKKKNLRIIKCSYTPDDKDEIITIDGGILKQNRDAELFSEIKCVTEKKPTEKQMNDMKFGMKVAKYIKSNGIVVVRDGMASGIGTGQVNRIWAAQEAMDRGEGAEIMVSDGFFPFSDVVEEAGTRGIKVIMQPGGSIRDEDSIKKCDELDMVMVLTGMRHFKH